MMPLPRTTLLPCFFSLLLLASCASSSLTQNPESSLRNIQTLLPGDYIGTASSGEVYQSIVQLQVPAFGGEIFYHHISTESLRGPAMQQKFYTFDDNGKHMLTTVVLGRGELLTDETSMVRKLNALAEEQLLRFPDSCKFEWTSTKDGFEGIVRRDLCSYESEAFDALMNSEVTYQLSRCGLFIHEGIYAADGSPVFPPSDIDSRRVAPLLDGC